MIKMEEMDVGLDDGHTAEAEPAPKVNYVRLLEKAAENLLRNALSEPSPSVCVPAPEIADSIRFNVDRDVKELVTAYAQLEQFFISSRFVYSQTHPEKVLEARIKDMKRALVRKDELIRQHHKNLTKWSDIIHNGVPQTGSVPDRPDSGQATGPSGFQTESQLRSVSAQNRAHTQSAGSQLQSFPPSSRVLSPPTPFSYATPSTGNFQPGPGQQIFNRPPIQQQRGYAPRSQSPGAAGYPGTGSGYPRAPGMTSLSAMLSQPSPGNILPPHQMRAPSPNMSGGAPYAQSTSPRMPHWRPPGIQPQQPGFGTDDSEMYNPHVHGNQ